MKLILIPLNRFEVIYEIVKSEPYAEVHKLLLESIMLQSATLEQLQETFQIPPRMLIEVLVNLFYDGWVTVTSEGFRLTPKGRASMKEGARPSNYLSVSAKTSFMMERISGSLIHKDEIAFDRKNGLKRRGLWAYATPMRVEHHDNRVDAAQARFLLREQGGGYIRNIETPKMTSEDWHWLPVDVDPAAGEVIGLPGRWKTLLQDRLLEFAANLDHDVPSGYWGGSLRQRKERTTRQAQGWATDLSADDLLSSTRQHSERLRAVLETARTSVLIMSSVLGSVSADVRDLIDKARARGVTVDLFWGTGAGRGDFPAGYFLNDEPNNCRANLLLYDTNDDNDGKDKKYKALVGSYPWLDVSGEEDVNATVMLHHPGIVADLCDSAATAIEAGNSEMALSEAPLRWKDTARKQEEMAPTLRQTEGYSVVSVVRDQDHAVRLREYLLTAQERCAVLSARADEAIKRLDVLAPRLALTPMDVRVCLGSETPAAITTLPAVAKTAGVMIRPTPELNANAVVADTSVLISGYEFLTSSRAGRTRPFHIGIAIEGGPLADKVWDMTQE